MRSNRIAASSSAQADNNERTPSNSIFSLDLRSIACIPLRRFQMSDNMDATMMLKRDVIGVLCIDSHSQTEMINQTSIRLRRIAFSLSRRPNRLKASG
ncbi:MAG: hypothetical protein IPJ07_23245 [Acidobacteria bacterium]|nr:hypothetical protein [Acidobacteriota bacterium]